MSAHAVIRNVRSELSDVFENPCNGEPVIVSGTQHLLIAFTPGGGGHLHLHLNSQKVTGLGLLTQTRYSVSETEVVSLNVQLGGELVATVLSRILFVSHGSAPNFELFQLSHLFVSATGVETVKVDRVRAECRGNRQAAE